MLALIFSVFSFLYGYFNPLKITPADKLILKLQQAVPDENKCVLTTKKNILEIFDEFMDMDQRVASISVELLIINNKIEEFESKLEMDRKRHNIMLDEIKREINLFEKQSVMDSVVQEEFHRRMMGKMEKIEIEINKNKKNYEALLSTQEKLSIPYMQAQMDFWGWFYVNGDYIPRKYSKKLARIEVINLLSPVLFGSNRIALGQLLLTDDPSAVIYEKIGKESGISLSDTIKDALSAVIYDENIRSIAEDLLRYTRSPEIHKSEVELARQRVKFIIRSFLEEYYGIDKEF